jgi:heat shock protein 90kDa beta
MDILINSLYTQKEIFLREVISNGSDALDKIRFLALTDPSVLGDTKELEIRIEINEEEKYIQFRDTGVGMSRAELIQNLGTVAKSGTTNYLSALKEGKINLIGQFGVGFYSTFLVGRKVVVISKANHDDQHIWTSESAAAYTVEKDPEGNTLGRGTIVRIYLKEDALEFLNHKKVSKLVKRYSEFIDFPIFIHNKKEVEEEVPVAAAEGEEELEVREKGE